GAAAPPASGHSAAHEPRRTTRLAPPEPMLSQRRQTVLGITPGAPSPARARAPQPLHRAPQAQRATDTRPIVAVLVAPDYGPGGALFALRAGRNRIGADPGADVVLDADPRVSGDHALVLHRADRLYLSDRLSTNGTQHNGVDFDPTQDAVPLADRDRIRCGDTELIVLLLPSSSEPSPDDALDA
ncbi:MAG: FHA domain-containing protein, partial [Acidobacteriota bacterium]